MEMAEKTVAEWYANHPISAPHILTKLTGNRRESVSGFDPERTSIPTIRTTTTG